MVVGCWADSSDLWPGGEMSSLLQNYRRLQTDFMEDDHERVVSVTSLSVQLFTVPTMVSTPPTPPAPPHTSLSLCPPLSPAARITNACRATMWKTTTAVSSPSLTCQCKCSPYRHWWVQVAAAGVDVIAPAEFTPGLFKVGASPSGGTDVRHQWEKCYDLKSSLKFH